MLLEMNPWAGWFVLHVQVVRQMLYQLGLPDLILKKKRSQFVAITDGMTGILHNLESKDNLNSHLLEGLSPVVPSSLAGTRHWI